jgi:hypothetical protein
VPFERLLVILEHRNLSRNERAATGKHDMQLCKSVNHSAQWC